MTVAELYRWSVAHHWSKPKWLRMEEYLLDNFVIVTSSWDLCRKRAEVTDQARHKGIPIQCGGLDCRYCLA